MDTTSFSSYASRASNAQLIAHVVGIGLPALTLFPLNQALVDEYIQERLSRPLMLEVKHPSASAQSTHVVQISDVDARLISTMAAVFDKLAKSQKDLDLEDQRILYKHLWDLY